MKDANARQKNWSLAALLRHEAPHPALQLQPRDALGRDLEAVRYAADRTFRQYDAADPANRLVAGELEARWNQALARVAEVESKIAAHDAASPSRSSIRLRSAFWLLT